ncbi:hypothetical protein [Amycolatopsis magusensis]|uniref:hypothetical protein n=1 Tax=Amycolatopsis magusensis TaxID=882444 RepID=UPI0037AB6951
MRTSAVLTLLLVLLLPALVVGASAPPPAVVDNAADSAPSLLPPPPPARVQPDVRDAVYGDVLLVGNSSVRCPTGDEPSGDHPAARCAEATQDEAGSGLLDNSANNNGYYMHLADTDDLPKTFTSSAATLTIPAGAQVRRAQLNWGGHTGTFLGFSGVNCQRPLLQQGDPPPPPAAATPAQQAVGLSVAGGTPVAVPAVPEHYRTVEGLTEPSQIYTQWADVTAAFAKAPAGKAFEVSVSNVWVPTGPGCAGGWSLVVAYDHGEPTAAFPHPRVVDLYSGTLPQGGALLPGLLEPLVPGFPGLIDTLLPGLVPGLSGTRVLLAGVAPNRSAAGVSIGITAFDGDRHQGEDTFTVDGKAMPEPCTGDGTGDFFRSCAQGASPATANNLSVDAKTVRPVLGDAENGDIEIGVNSVADYVVVSNVVLAETVTPGISAATTGPAGPVREGDLAEFTTTITNTGNLPLTDLTAVSTSDPPSTPRCSPAALPPLAPGAQTQVTCVHPAAGTNLLAKTTVTGTYLVASGGDARTVSATAEAAVPVAPADFAVLRIPSKLTVRQGSPVEFAVTLINNTDNELQGVQYADGATTGCTAAPATLPAHSTAALTCTLAAATQSFTSNGVLTGTDVAGAVTAQSQSVTVTVINPAAALTVVPDPDTVYRGSPVTFTFTATNTGTAPDGPLLNPVVSTPNLPGCTPEPLPALPPGASASTTCTAAPEQTVQVAAQLVATDSSATEVTAEAPPATVTVLDPFLQLAQQADPSTLRTGGATLVTFTATNMGTAEQGALSDVRITSPSLPPGCAPGPITSLAPGQSESRTCTVSPDRTFDNLAEAAATDSTGREMTAEADPLTITVLNPALVLDVAADPAQAQHGARATITETLRNIGNVALEVTLANDNAPDCDLSLVDTPLRAGAAQGVRCEVVLPRDEATTTYTNTATYQAEPTADTGDQGPPLTSAQSTEITLLAGQAPAAPAPGADPGSDPGSDPGGQGSDAGSTGTGPPDGTGARAQAGKGKLANTGFSLAGPVSLAAALLITGSLALVVARPRKQP